MKTSNRHLSMATGIVTLLVAGCTSLVPPFERPAAPVAESFPYTSASVPGTAQVADITWQQFLRDERLRQLVTLALRYNRDLRVAVLSINQARAQLQLKRADELPTVNVGATGARQPTAAGGSSSTYSAGFNVTGYEFDLFGRIQSLTQAAQAQLLATEEARKTVQISLVATVANTYLSLLADDELLRITGDTLQTREDALRLTRLKFDQGVSSELDWRQAQSLLESARVA
jgi:multidrug efflux system outer membrane protein